MTTYKIQANYGMCPNQIEGITDEGKHFYFRGDGWEFTLGFGDTFDEALDDVSYEGEAYNAGYMHRDEFEELFWDVIKSCVENGFKYPQAAFRIIEVHKARWRELEENLALYYTAHSIEVTEAVSLVRKYNPDRNS